MDLSKSVGEPEYDNEGNFVSAELVLKDGARVAVRPARPEDRPGLEQMFKSCSSETLYTRFLSPGLGVPLRYLDRLMRHSPPQVIALVAEVDDAGGPRIVGLMNFVAIETLTRGEIAIVVTDEYQNRGLGSGMLRCLYQLAARQGVKKFVADVDAGNRRVFHLLKRSNLPCAISIDQGVAHAEVEMSADKIGL